MRPLPGCVMNIRHNKHHIRECVAKRVKFSTQLPSGSSFARQQTNGYCEIQLIFEVNESRYVWNDKLTLTYKRRAAQGLTNAL